MTRTKNLKRVLIIQTAFLGDVILATSLIEKIHHFYPDSSIDFLVRKGNESLLLNHPKLNQVLVLHKKRRKYRNLWEMIKTIRHNKYDLLINVQRYFTTGLIAAFSGAEITVGFNKNPLSFLFSRKIPHLFDGQHEIERNQQLISKITDEKPAMPRLYPASSDFDSVKKYQSAPYICIAPASVWFTKQFPEEKWVELTNNIPENILIFITGSSNDHQLAERIVNSSMNRKLKNLCGQLSLLESAALMEKAVLNITNDSAPMHIASSMNANTCAVYCSTLPEFGYGPLADKSCIIETESELKCRSCGIHGRSSCPEGHFKCGYDIEVKRIADMINENMV